MASGPRLEAPAGLLARWGIPADAQLTQAERGSNNQTFAVAHRGELLSVLATAEDAEDAED